MVNVSLINKASRKEVLDPFKSYIESRIDYLLHLKKKKKKPYTFAPFTRAFRYTLYTKE